MLVFNDMFSFEVVEQISRVTSLSWNFCPTHSTEYILLLLIGRLKSKPSPNNRCCTSLFHELLCFADAFSHVYSR